MPSTKVSGKFGEIWVGATLAAAVKFAAIQDWTYSEQGSEIDVSDHDSGGYGESLVGIIKTKISARGFYLADNSTFAQDSAQGTLDGTVGDDTPQIFWLLPNGKLAGKACIKLSGRVMSLTMSSPTNGAIGHDLEIVGVGAPDRTPQT
jgi:hypothetical protein